jgi:hypothetical protein
MSNCEYIHKTRPWYFLVFVYPFMPLLLPACLSSQENLLYNVHIPYHVNNIFL